jgi:hypothetical protein
MHSLIFDNLCNTLAPTCASTPARFEKKGRNGTAPRYDGKAILEVKGRSWPPARLHASGVWRYWHVISLHRTRASERSYVAETGICMMPFQSAAAAGPSRGIAILTQDKWRLAASR